MGRVERSCMEGDGLNGLVSKGEGRSFKKRSGLNFLVSWGSSSHDAYNKILSLKLIN